MRTSVKTNMLLLVAMLSAACSHEVQRITAPHMIEVPHVSFTIAPQDVHFDKPPRHDPYFVAGSRQSEAEAAEKELLDKNNDPVVQAAILQALAPNAMTTLTFPNPHEAQLFASILQIRDADRGAAHYERSRAAARHNSLLVEVAFVDAAYLDGNAVRVVRSPADPSPELILVNRETATANDIAAGLGLMTELRRRYGDLTLEMMSASIPVTPGGYSAAQLSVAERLLRSAHNAALKTLKDYGNARAVGFRLGPVGA